MNRTPALAGPDGPAARPARAGRAGLAAKWAIDILGALTGLAVFGLPMLALAACMRWQLGCPALFRQVRVTGPGRQAAQQTQTLTVVPRCTVAPSGGLADSTAPGAIPAHLNAFFLLIARPALMSAFLAAS